MNNPLLDTVTLFSRSRSSDPKVIKQFTNRIMKGRTSREENTDSHLCVFFLPIHLSTRSIYLVHHKKAHDWIPPGGHINRNESPLQTVHREFREELDFSLTDEPRFPFATTILHISNPRTPCKTHFDFWYVIPMREQAAFVWDKGEFFDASWIKFEKALHLTKQSVYAAVLPSLKAYFTNELTVGTV